MFRFTIRDLLWLMVAVALSLARFAEHSRIATVHSLHTTRKTRTMNLSAFPALTYLWSPPRIPLRGANHVAAVTAVVSFLPKNKREACLAIQSQVGHQRLTDSIATIDDFPLPLRVRLLVRHRGASLEEFAWGKSVL